MCTTTFLFSCSAQGYPPAQSSNPVILETGSGYVAQDGFEFPSSTDPLPLPPKYLWLTDMCHRAPREGTKGEKKKRFAITKSQFEQVRHCKTKQTISQENCRREWNWKCKMLNWD